MAADPSFSSAEVERKKRKRGGRGRRGGGSDSDESGDESGDESDEVELEDFEKRELLRVSGGSWGGMSQGMSERGGLRLWKVGAAEGGGPSWAKGMLRCIRGLWGRGGKLRAANRGAVPALVQAQRAGPSKRRASWRFLACSAHTLNATAGHVTQVLLSLNL